MVHASYRLIVTFLSIIGVVAENTTLGTAANNIFWCGLWAGQPSASTRPRPPYELPSADGIMRLFVQPELQLPAYGPLPRQNPIVQLPKLFGKDQFRLALLSYASKSGPVPIVYAHGYSTWLNVLAAFEDLLQNCVRRGAGGAIVVNPLPGYYQPSLVLYAYTPGSMFDKALITSMVLPSGIDPAQFNRPFLISTNNSATAFVSAPLERPVGHPNPVVTS